MAEPTLPTRPAARTPLPVARPLPHAPSWPARQPHSAWTPAKTASASTTRSHVLKANKIAAKGLLGWLRVHRIASALAALMLISVTVAAALLIQQNVTTSPSAVAPDVKFLTGTDYATINAAGFATVNLGTSGASATLAMSGVSGAASVALGNIMRLQDTSATKAYTVTLARSTTVNAAITSFSVVVKNGGTTLVTWDAASAASSSSFTLPVSTTLDISITTTVTDGTAAGALGSFAMEFQLT